MTIPTSASRTQQSFPENARFLTGPVRAVWHKSAPRDVRRAFAASNDSDGWIAWKRHLATRQRPVALAKLLPGGSDPLGWALPDGLLSLPVPSWLERAGRLAAQRPSPDPALQSDVILWLGESAGRATGPACALETLASARALPRLAAVLTAETWWALLDYLLSAVADTGAIEPDEDPLTHQLLGGELALTLAYLLPEVGPCRKLKSAARRLLSGGLIDLLDGQGLPHAKHLAVMRPLLACWTRCRAMGERLGGCFTAPAAAQYEWLVRQTLRLTRHDGTHVFSGGSIGSPDTELIKAALRFDDDDEDRRIAALVSPRSKKNGSRRATETDLPEPANHSEWAATAVLRPQWARTGERLTVVYPGQSLQLELACAKDVIFSGDWDLEVRVDGKRAAPSSDWDEVCWISDEDVDYLELEIDLGDRVRLQRQMLLAREDGFLLLADAVLGQEVSGATPGRIEYRGRLPLCPGVSFRGADETREGFLAGSKRRAAVLPLALPEWRSERGVGELTYADPGLELRQTSEGRCLYAPLFFDLDRRRQTRRLTWRQLTVAQSLEVQPADVAVGYRVAIGDDQWLIYRSLAEKANRTLLGHNLSTEMLVAQFDESGEVEPLIEIE